MNDLSDLPEEDCQRLKNNIQDAKPSVIMSAKDWIEVWVPAVEGNKGEILYYSAKLDVLRYATFSEFYGSNG